MTAAFDLLRRCAARRGWCHRATRWVNC